MKTVLGFACIHQLGITTNFTLLRSSGVGEKCGPRMEIVFSDGQREEVNEGPCGVPSHQEHRGELPLGLTPSLPPAPRAILLWTWRGC